MLSMASVECMTLARWRPISSYMNPKLTIVIPHLNRTDFLAQAIEHALDQSVPAKILVADQGHTPETAELMEKYSGHRLVMHCKTDATCLHDNWNAGYRLATADGAKYVAIYQDDDIIHHRYSERINLAFDVYHDALTWTARLNCAQDPELAIWFSGVGPLIPMNLMKNRARILPGIIMLPYGYLTSWALSPAVAFRAGVDLNEALDAIPRDCDLYTERTILAEMGTRGPVVVDPVVIGYWVHHAKNESYRQNANTQPEQAKVFYEWMDRLMDKTDGWEEIFLEWTKTMPNTHLAKYIQDSEDLDSRYALGIAEVLRSGMKPEISYEELRRRRATDPTITTPMTI